MRAEHTSAGFTLVEALVAIAIMGLVVGALAKVTAQWLPNWHQGLLRVQRNEQVAIALDRLAADLAAAQFVTPNGTSKAPLFEGHGLAVSFVRSAIGPNRRPGLEIVHIAETVDGGERMLVRTRTPFVPLPPGDVSIDAIPFADPVVLLRAPFRVEFAYANEGGEWRSDWPGASGALPSAVRFSVRDVAAGRALPVTTATAIHVNAAAPVPEETGQPGQPQDDADGGGK